MLSAEQGADDVFAHGRRGRPGHVPRARTSSIDAAHEERGERVGGAPDLRVDVPGLVRGAQQGPVPAGELHADVQQLPQPARVVDGRQVLRRRDLGRQRAGQLLQERGDDVPAPVEVAVEGGAGEAGLRHDRVHVQRGEAAALEHDVGGGEDPPPRLVAGDPRGPW